MCDIFMDLYLTAQNGDSEKQKVWSEVKNIFVFKNSAGLWE